MNILKDAYEKIKKRKNMVSWLRNHGTEIGDDCEIYPDVSFGSEPYLIRIGNHVRITSGVKLITHDGGVWVLRGIKDTTNSNVDLFGTITIGDNTHIGMNSVIMPGVEIGKNCIIGCCSVVTKNIPDNSVAVGIPARVIETIAEYNEKNKNRFVFTKNYSQTEKKAYLLKKYGKKE